MKSFHLIVVGRYADSSFEQLEHHYLKQIPKNIFQLHEVKSHSENKTLEGQEVLKKISEIEKADRAYVFLMAERGKLYSSEQLTKLIHHDLTKNLIILVIGGAAGHGEEVVRRADSELSLSPMTFPHKMARLLLIEQFYRTLMILKSHPYHK